MQIHYRNGFNQKSEEYEDDEYDDYDDDGVQDEADDYEEKVEEPKPNKEELEFLKLREKLKEKFRQKLKKQSDHSSGHSSQAQDRKKTSANDNFGSFFGPSQPVIASRVLDESRSIRETQHITSKILSSSTVHGRIPEFSSSDLKFCKQQQIPKVDEVKIKAQTLKDMRDYSFLFSDDADADLPDKELPSTSRHVSSPKPVAQPAQTSLESKVIASRSSKTMPNGHVLKNAIPACRQVQTKAPMKIAEVSRHIPSSAEPRKLSGRSTVGIGPGRPVEPKSLPKPIQLKVPSQSKVDEQVMVSKKPVAKGVNGLCSQKNLSTLKPYNSTQNHHVEQKRGSQAAATIRSEHKLTPKQAPSLKSQPSKSIPSCDIHQARLTKRPVKIQPDDDDDADAIQMIRNMFRYNPSKYTGMDDDDSDMEAGFSQILQEERRSELIARKEDEEQLLLIEEEERRERLRKKQRLNRR